MKFYSVKYFNNPVVISLILVIALYLAWMWSVMTRPPFSDIQDWQETDFSQKTISFEAIVEGGPGKDGIQSLDHPAFVNIEQARQWLDAREPVIVFTHAHESRAYPLQILMYHEIVNDKVLDQAIAVTYCPLCNAAMVFAREINNEQLEFSVSGKIYNSNLVMYDRQSQSWWLQFTGEGIVGKHAGATLKLLPSQLVSFAQFQHAYADGKVLSRKTGFNKKYGVNPYAHYDSRKLPVTWFYGKPYDNRLPAMHRVLGVVLAQQAMAFPLTELNQSALLETHFADEPILIISKAGMASAVDKKIIKQSKDVRAAVAFSRMLNGRQLDFTLIDDEIVDKQTNSVWNMFGESTRGQLSGSKLQQLDRGVYFSFVWLDFYPQSKIFNQANR